MATPLTKAEARRLLQPIGHPLLCGVTVENFRGFYRATLDLRRDLIVLVGPNNSGKTSLVRLLEWSLNDASDDLLRGERRLTSAEEALLIPARNTRGGARRLTLHIRLRDGRRHARFFAKDGVARLRLRLRDDRVYANIRPLVRSEPLTHEEDAIVLLHELREATFFKYIPASRDAASVRFSNTLTTALEAKLGERAIHQTQAGAPGEYRQMKNALTTLQSVAEQLAAPLSDRIRAEVLPGLSRSATLKLDVDAQDLVKWMAQKMAFRLVTGEHDPRSVAPVEVGSGLQSLLDLAVMKGEGETADIDQILAIEEPEAFLHPTAQRTLARRLVRDDSTKRIISTHSPIFVDECSTETSCSFAVTKSFHRPCFRTIGQPLTQLS